MIWIYGYRVLRRVRRVALSDKSSSRRHIVWEDAIANLPNVDPLTGQPRIASPWMVNVKCPPAKGTSIWKRMIYGSNKVVEAKPEIEAGKLRLILRGREELMAEGGVPVQSKG